MTYFCNIDKIIHNNLFFCIKNQQKRNNPYTKRSKKAIRLSKNRLSNKTMKFT